MVVMPFFDTSLKITLIDHIACVCFLLAAIFVEYKTQPIMEKEPIRAISILLIPILLLAILSITGVVHFFPADIIYAMSFVVAGGYPGKQAILPNTSMEWAKVIATVSLIALFVIVVSNANVLKAVSDFVSFVLKQL
jgi:hypothetical protein